MSRWIFRVAQDDRRVSGTEREETDEGLDGRSSVRSAVIDPHRFASFAGNPSQFPFVSFVLFRGQ